MLLAYSAAVFQNCGNYKAFGDSKFVPEISPEKLKAVVRASEAYETHSEIIDKILELIEKEMYAEEDPYKMIGFRDANGTTSYYTSNITQAEAKRIDDFCQTQKISPLNTRLFKLRDNVSS